MITVKDLQEKNSADLAVPLTYTVFAMIQTARLALENDNGGVDDPSRLGSIAIVLELAESLAYTMGDGTEALQRAVNNAARAAAGVAA